MRVEGLHVPQPRVEPAVDLAVVEPAQHAVEEVLRVLSPVNVVRPRVERGDALSIVQSFSCALQLARLHDVVVPQPPRRPQAFVLQPAQHARHEPAQIVLLGELLKVAKFRVHAFYLDRECAVAALQRPARLLELVSRLYVGLELGLHAGQFVHHFRHGRAVFHARHTSLGVQPLEERHAPRKVQVAPQDVKDLRRTHVPVQVVHPLRH